MKKFINGPENLEAEITRGLALAKPGLLRQLPGSNILVRQNLKKDKVSLVFGCGSGHEPAPGGYVGVGMLDAAVPGKIFSSPTPDMILKGIYSPNGDVNGDGTVNISDINTLIGIIIG